MNLMKLLSGDGFVMYNREIAHEVSVNGAIIFGQLCSSHSYFETRNELAVFEGKKHFYMTAEKLTEYTALSYKQQLKAIKELENAGYIETTVKGLPATKYFHIVLERIFKGISGYAEKEELDKSTFSNDELSATLEPISYDQREILDVTKGENRNVQKVKEIINNNKIKIKDNNLVNKVGNKDEIINNLISQYRLKGLSKDVCLLVLKEVEANPSVQNFGGYLRTSLENALHRSQVKRGIKDPNEKLESALKNSPVPFYNWLDEEEESPISIKDDDLPF